MFCIFEGAAAATNNRHDHRHHHHHHHHHDHCSCCCRIAVRIKATTATAACLDCPDQARPSDASVECHQVPLTFFAFPIPIRVRKVHCTQFHALRPI
ncbi:hypothetical protein ACLKA7_009358 [Drosophila subpalustris]